MYRRYLPPLKSRCLVFLKYLLILSLLISLPVVSIAVLAEPEPIPRDKAKATFMVKIFLNVTWPNEDTIDRFCIGLYGKDRSLQLELSNAFKGMRVRDKPVEIKMLSNLADAHDCHALILAPQFNRHFKAIAAKLRQTETLLVTDMAEDKRSVMINFYDVSPTRLAFEVNRSSLLYEGLEPKKNLLLFGGTELDIALIHKETEAELERAVKAVEQQRRELERQGELLLAQTETIVEQQSDIKRQRMRIEQQSERIRRQGEKIQAREAELERLEKNLNLIKEALNENEGMLNETESVLAQKEADIYSYSKQILQNLGHLKGQKLEIQQQEELIAEQKAILSQQIDTIKNQRLILAAAIGALATFFALIVIIFRGSQEKQQVNRKLENKTSELEAVNEKLLLMSDAKSQFLSTMSHEIRTPLNGVLGMVELLKDTPINEQQRHYLETVHTSGEMLLSVINDVLDYSKIEAGKMSIETVPFDLEKLIFGCAPVFAQRATPTLAFVADVVEGTPLHLRGDPTRIRQILLNLLSNAFKFTSSGEIKLVVQALPPGENKWEFSITVSDTGVGLSEEQRSHIFNAFTQADTTTTRRYGGTGLGLAISQRLANLMGGSISVTSEPGRGSSFVVKLPLVPSAPLPPAAGDGGIGFARETGRRFGNAQVLVVEDNSVNQMVIKGFLTKLGVAPEFANNGREAVDIYRRRCLRDQAKMPYDLIFMDCEMPEMDGFSATREIRALESGGGRPRVAIVALTAHAMDAQRQKALAAGMDEHLAKPVRLDVLESMLLRFIA